MNVETSFFYCFRDLSLTTAVHLSFFTVTAKQMEKRKTKKEKGKKHKAMGEEIQ
jgi:hypothetical protein